MIDFEQLQLLIYQHAVQLTLIDHPVKSAFALAHEVARLAFDEDFTRRGLACAAGDRQGSPAEQPASDGDDVGSSKDGSAF